MNIVKYFKYLTSFELNSTQLNRVNGDGLLNAVHMFIEETTVKYFNPNVSQIGEISISGPHIPNIPKANLAMQFNWRGAGEYSVYPEQPQWVKRPIKERPVTQSGSVRLSVALEATLSNQKQFQSQSQIIG